MGQITMGRVLEACGVMVGSEVSLANGSRGHEIVKPDGTVLLRLPGSYRNPRAREMEMSSAYQLLRNLARGNHELYVRGKQLLRR